MSAGGKSFTAVGVSQARMCYMLCVPTRPTPADFDALRAVGMYLNKEEELAVPNILLPSESTPGGILAWQSLRP